MLKYVIEDIVQKYFLVENEHKALSHNKCDCIY